jgi:glycosyltransferase involved in cell wall biosynthesis
MATYDRVDPVSRFIKSLVMQTYPNFELIIVDQNPDERLEALVQSYADTIQITHLRSDIGASHARNIGSQVASGKILAFPDDDCWYAPSLLERVTAVLRDNVRWDGAVGRPIEADGRAADSYRPCGTEVTRYNAWRLGIASTIFLRRPVVDHVGHWDVTIGPGSGGGFVAGEDTDYLIRALDCGYELHYEPSVTVFHPDPAEYDKPYGRRRGYLYGRSIGALLRRHSYPSWHLAYFCSRPLGGAFLWSLRRRKRRAIFHWSVFRGRLSGTLRPTRP